MRIFGKIAERSAAPDERPQGGLVEGSGRVEGDPEVACAHHDHLAAIAEGADVVTIAVRGCQAPRVCPFTVACAVRRFLSKLTFRIVESPRDGDLLQVCLCTWRP
jgi:hypothetical protein